MPEAGLWAGAISGTSMDGIDCALVNFDNAQAQVLGSHCHPLTDTLRNELFVITDAPQVSLAQLGRLHVALGEAFADALCHLLATSRVNAAQVRAIGSHGQTVFHQPQGEYPFSMQLGDANIIAARTGINTIADFRGMDLALGGQGAPLAPLFHQACFRSNSEDRAVLNIGGISNLTLLPADLQHAVVGFDTGPGNVLMDYWINHQQQQRYDAGGHWASQGNCHVALLERMRADAYFSRATPKSTGREHFNGNWLQHHLAEFSTLGAADVQATLLKLTATTVVDALMQSLPQCRQLIVCGGGSHNTQLMQQLQLLLPQCKIDSSDGFGVDADWVEAVTFAWLAQKYCLQQAVDCRQLTGARRPAILGACYQAPK